MPGTDRISYVAADIAGILGQAVADLSHADRRVAVVKKEDRLRDIAVRELFAPAPGLHPADPGRKFGIGHSVHFILKFIFIGRNALQHVVNLLQILSG